MLFPLRYTLKEAQRQTKYIVSQPITTVKPGNFSLIYDTLGLSGMTD